MSAHGELEQDEHGSYIAIDADGPGWKPLDGLERPPRADEHVELRVYTAHTRKAVIERNDDLLTPQEVEENHALVTQAIIDELKTWQSFDCFTQQKRREATNLIDTKWVYKWKVKGGKRFIRARLCLRGFRENQVDDQNNSSPTASRLSQRLLVSEAALRKDWVLASSDAPKAFLQGVSYEELARLTGKPLQNVSFELV